MAKAAKAELPVQQLAILAIARLAEPLAATSIYPYLPNMIRDLGVPQPKVAKYAGLTTATFSISQSLFAVPWGKASDRLGRKPVLVFGLLTTMLGFLAWGMSTSLAMALTVRALLGACNGNVGILRTMVAEMVPQRELQPAAFSIMPLVWALGSVVGPAFGGFFAQPATQYPDVFGGWRFFERFPYALPNFIATAFFLISAASAVFFLEETHRDLRGRKDWGLAVGRRLTRAFNFRRRKTIITTTDDDDDEPLIPAEETRTKKCSPISKGATMREVFSPQTSLILASYTWLAFHSNAFDQTISVFLDYPSIPRTPHNTSLPFKFTGGFGFDSGTIGTIFAIYGIMAGSVQFLLYPPLVRRYGVLRLFRLCAVLTPLIYLATPYTVLFPTPRTRLVSVLVVMAAKAFVIIIGFPSTVILLTNSVGSVRVLGTLNGFATMFTGLGRAFGPATTGVAYTWGVERGYIVAGFFYMALVAALAAVPAFYVVEGDGPSEEEEEQHDAEEGGDAERESAPLLGGERNEGQRREQASRLG